MRTTANHCILPSHVKKMIHPSSQRIDFICFFTHQQLWVACCPRAAQWRRWPTRGGGTLGSAVSRRLTECHSTTHSPPSWRPDCRNGDEEGFFWKVKITRHVIIWTNGSRTVLSQVNLVPLLWGKIKVQTFYYNSRQADRNNQNKDYGIINST